MKAWILPSADILKKVRKIEAAAAFPTSGTLTTVV